MNVISRNGCFTPEDNKLGSAVLDVTGKWVGYVLLCLGCRIGFGYHGSPSKRRFIWGVAFIYIHSHLTTS